MGFRGGFQWSQWIEHEQWEAILWRRVSMRRKAKVHDSLTLYIWWTFHAVSVKLRDRIILLWCKTIYSNSWRLSLNLQVEIRLWNEKLLFCLIIYYRANNTVVCSIFIKTYDPIPLQTLRRLVLREIAPNLQKLLVLLLPRGLFS